MAEIILNPFIRPHEAERYQNYRPQYHHIPFQKLTTVVGNSLESGLDVACGTGHSTLALTKICKVVSGCDLSPAMLAEARRHSDLPFVECSAENLTFPNASFDMVNISMGIHWLDQDRFLKEAARVLRKKGYLSIDNYGFTGKMFPDNGFSEFNNRFWKENFPAPPRNKNYPEDSILLEHGFRLVTEIHYDHLMVMGLHSFVGFLMTQSNVLSKNSEPEATITLLTKTYEPFFGDQKQEVLFGGLLKLHQLAA